MRRSDPTAAGAGQRAEAGLDRFSELTRSAHVLSEVLDGETVLYDRRTTSLHVLDSTASAVWSELGKRAALGEVAARLADRYGAEPPTVLADVVRTAEDFARAGLLDGYEQEPACPSQEPAPGRPPAAGAPTGRLEDFGTPAWAGPEALDALPWAHVSPCFRALDWEFTFRTTHAELGRHLEMLFAPMLTDEVAGTPHSYSLICEGLVDGEVGALYADGQRVRWSVERDVLLGYLLWHLNQSVIGTASGSLTLLHAGVVEREGRAALLVAPAESGKTTLTAGLVARGCGYLSDEVAALTGDGTVRAYPKPLSVDPGSWDALQALRPEVPEPVQPFLRTQWQLRADQIRAGACQEQAQAHVVVLPQYVAGAQTRMTDVGRAAALVEVAQQTFTWPRDPERAMRVVSRLLSNCAVKRLVFSDLDQACAQVEGTLTA